MKRLNKTNNSIENTVEVYSADTNTVIACQCYCVCKCSTSKSSAKSSAKYSDRDSVFES